MDSLSLFGKIFVCRNSYSAPEMIRVVGFTKKKVIVENVPVISIHSRFGSTHRADTEWLNQNPLIEPITKSNSSCTLMMIKCEEDQTYLKYKNACYFETNDLNIEYQSCEY